MKKFLFVIAALLFTTSISWATKDINFTYDRMGRLKTVSDSVGNRTFNYNDKLQLESEEVTGYYTADIIQKYSTTGVKGRHIGFKIDSIYDVTYGYDQLGRLNSVSWNIAGKTGSVTYTFVPKSNLIEGLSTSEQIGYKVSYAYEPHRDLKTQVKNQIGQTVISQYDYTYDALARRKTTVLTGSSSPPGGAHYTFDYNQRSELTESQNFPGTDLINHGQPNVDKYGRYQYDSIGNRKNTTEGTSTKTYTANSLNQYTDLSTDENNQPFSYDDDGNLTSSGDQDIEYNTENRVISAVPENPVEGSKKVEVTYDYKGRRVQKIISIFNGTEWRQKIGKFYIYDGWNLIQEITRTGVGESSKYYIWGHDLSQSLKGAGGVGGLIACIDDGITYYYMYDGNGNVMQIINGDDGSVAATYEYDPFGNIVSSTGYYADVNPIRFSSKYHDDESGLVYYGYRYYDPEPGRWVNRDPMGEDGGYNLYGFVENSPFEYIDPFGLALYAFDGTWNDRTKMKSPTNVAILTRSYMGIQHYLPGVGTDWYTKHAGGATGAGGQNRLDAMFKYLIRTYNRPGDGNHKKIDIIGFSRGAALARAFANKIDKEGVPPSVNAIGKGCPVEIRFLGIFDTVGSFGMPGNSIDIGYDLSIPDNVLTVAHAVAGDEKRSMFPLTSILPGPDASPFADPRFQEKVFPGAHSDIGGGYADGDLSDAALMWVRGVGKSVGVPFGPLPAHRYSVTNPWIHDERSLWERFWDKPRKIYYINKK